MKKYTLFLILFALTAGLQAQETVSGNRWFMGRFGVRTKTPGQNIGFKGIVRFMNDTTGSIDIRIPQAADTFMLTLPASVPSVENYFVSINPSGAMVNKKPELSQLGDVDVTGITNGKILYYHATSAKWRDTTMAAGAGTVTSVGLSMPTGFTVSSSPVTSSGTIAVSPASVGGYHVLRNGSSSPGTWSFGKLSAPYLQLTSGKMIIGDASNNGIEKSVTGDITGVISGANWVTSISEDSVHGNNISLTSEANGDLMYFNGTNWVRLAVGTSTQVLKGGTIPAWGAIAVADLPASTQDTTTNSHWRLSPSGYLFPRSATRVGIGTSALFGTYALQIGGSGIYLSSNTAVVQWQGGQSFGYLGGVNSFYSPGFNFRIQSYNGSAITNLFHINTQGASHNGFIGIGTTTPSYILSFSGQNAFTIGGERNTTANTAGVNMTLLAPGATIGATDKAGGTMIFKNGLGTGAAPSTAFEWYTSNPTTSGTTDQTQTLKMSMNYAGLVSGKAIELTGIAGNISLATGSATEQAFRAYNTITSSFSSNTAEIIRTATGAGTNVDGNLLQITEASTNGGTRTGKLINATYSTADKFSVDFSGNIIAAGTVTKAGVYGELYTDNGSTAQSIPTGTTYTKITGFAADGMASNTTVSNANDKITLLKTGKYRVTFSCSFTTGTNLITLHAAAFWNGTEQSNCHFARKIGTGSDVGSATFTGIISVTSASTDLDIRVRHTDGSSVDFTPLYMNMNVEYIGE